MRMRTAKLLVWSAVASALLATAITTHGQQAANPGFRSVGRGAPVAVNILVPPPGSPAAATPQRGGPPGGGAQAENQTPEQRAAALRQREPWTVGPIAQRAGGGFGGPPGAGPPAVGHRDLVAHVQAVLPEAAHLPVLALRPRRCPDVLSSPSRAPPA